MKKQRQITWPSLGTEETLRDITGNAFGDGIRQHWDSDVFYVMGDTGVSGPGAAPGDENEIENRIRLYTIDKKTAVAILIGSFGQLGSQNSGTDLATHSLLGQGEARATNPVAGGRAHYASVDLTTGAATSLDDQSSQFPERTVLYAIDFHPETNELWALHRTDTGTLKIGKLALDSITLSDVVTLSPALSPSLRCGMAFDGDATLYVVRGGGSANHPWLLYKLKDLTTGIADRVIDLTDNPGSSQATSGFCRVRG